ncbi:MAG: hypothetical protein JST26_17590 [Bacteroidetes bacterium]|nr:hypothetical protein [Bacteroidota bacterium]
METSDFRYFKHVLLKFGKQADGHAIDLKKLLLDIEAPLGAYYASELNDEEAITAIISYIEEFSTKRTPLSLFIQLSIVDYINRLFDYYIENYDSIRKATLKLMEDGLVGPEYWITSWPHEKVVLKEEFIASIKYSKDVWIFESKYLRQALKSIMFEPPFYDTNNDRDILSLKGLKE